MNVDLAVYAIVATLSPLGFAATLAVLASGRLSAILFAIAFVGAQLGTVVLLALADVALWPGHGESSRVRELVELAFGVLLLAAGLVVRRRGAAPAGDEHSLLERLHGLGPVTALAGGALLGIGGPKRLVLTALAATSIGRSDDKLALALAYTAIATLLVWLPVVLFVVLGDRALLWLRAGENWLTHHQRTIASWSLVVVGAFAIADSLVALL
jgi:hypothetical protein